MDNEQQKQDHDSSQTSSKKPSLGLVATIVILLLVGATIFWMQKNKTKNADTVRDAMHVESQDDGDGDHDTIKFEGATGSSTTSSSTYLSGNTITIGDTNSKKITVIGSSFKFAPSEIRVKKGDVVTINFQNSGGMHDFVIDEFNVKSKRISGGETDTVTFTASKTGTFEYYCSVGNHREMGMHGNLIVE
jgi:plastocyanin